MEASPSQTGWPPHHLAPTQGARASPSQTGWPLRGGPVERRYFLKTARKKRIAHPSSSALSSTVTVPSA